MSAVRKQEAPMWSNEAICVYEKLANTMRRLVCHMKKMTDTKL